MSVHDQSRGYWNATATATDFPQLIGEHHVDVAIVGAGIVGVTTARLLVDRGFTVAVVEALKVGQQATGQSTAKVTSQHGLLYQTLEKTFGEHHAGLYGQAQQAGIRLISDLAVRYNVDCDLQESPAYTYALDGDDIDRIEKEVEISQRLGLPASLVHSSELPFRIAAAIRSDHQFQFHPTNYVAGLARTIPGDGSHVFEHSKVTKWEPARVMTAQGSVHASRVIMATHLPPGQIGGYYARAYPNAEPVIAARISSSFEGMYLSTEEPGYSLRTHRQADGNLYAVVAGGTFKPGILDEERQRFGEIERWLKEHFQAGPVEYRWINEDYVSMDSMPLVGLSSSLGEGYLVATGFAGWGISNGTAAAIMLSDLIEGVDNPWHEVFDSKRIKPLAGGGKLLKETAGVATQLVKGYLSRKPDSCEDLERGKAAVVKIDGKNVAAFRDEEGTIHAVSAVCPHMGCLVGWSEADRCWDCPCHGSRFAISGDVIHGPAVEPLARIETD